MYIFFLFKEYTLSILPLTPVSISVVGVTFDIFEKVMNGEVGKVALERGISGSLHNNMKPLFNPLSANGEYDSPWWLLQDASLTLVDIRLSHNYQNDLWGDIDSSYPLFACNDNSHLMIVSCDFMMGPNVSEKIGVNGILVSRAYGVTCEFFSCSFIGLILDKTVLFYDGGNSSISVENCIIKNITSSSLRGTVYCCKNLTQKHDAFFINTEISEIAANSILFGGILYFISSEHGSIQHIINCSISSVNVTSFSDSLDVMDVVEGGALYYGNAPGVLLIRNSSFSNIKKAKKGGGICLDFHTQMADESVFAYNIFDSLEGVYGGAIYTSTNVCGDPFSYNLIFFFIFLSDIVSFMPFY
jgi:hypothetical protein